MNTMEEILNTFTEVTPNEAQALIDERNGKVIFIGFAQCPYCQKFAPKLKQVADEHDLTVYFVNSRRNDTIEDVETLRAKYDAKTVPTLIYAGEEEVSVKSDSSMPVEDIKRFVHVTQ